MSVIQFAAEAHARALKLLLPPGRLDLSPGSTWSDLLLGAADGLVRLGGRIADLLEESDPRTAVELLPEYERMLDIVPTGTDADRQACITSRLTVEPGFRPVDVQVALAPIYQLDPVDVVIIETSRALAILIGDDREIYRWFAFRDPGLGGVWDINAAQTLIDDIAHSHTKGHAIESVDFLCDDPFSLCDRDLLGV